MTHSSFRVTHTPSPLCVKTLDFLFFPPLKLFIYFWLRWVFIARRGLSLVAERGLLFLVAVRGLLIAVASFVVGARALGARASGVFAPGLTGSRAQAQ